MTERSRRSSWLLGGGALLAIACCVIGPAAIAASAGALLSGPLGLGAAIVVAVLCGLLAMRALSRGKGC